MFRWWKSPVPQLVARTCKSLLHAFTTGADDPGGLTINPYAGCAHRCVYCYATYDWTPEFYDTIVAKTNAPKVLARELAQWTQPAIPPVFLASATDAYQPAEGVFRLTRQCVEILQRCGVPYYIFTKSSSVVRDFDLHARYRNKCLIVWSLTTVDEGLKRFLEPYAAGVRGVLRAMSEAAARRIVTGVNVDPIIPGVTDDSADLKALVHACVAHGVRYFSGGLLRLREDIWPRIRGLLRALGRENTIQYIERLYFATPQRSGPYFEAPPDYQRKVLHELQATVQSGGAHWGLPIESETETPAQCGGMALAPKRLWLQESMLAYVPTAP